VRAAAVQSAMISEMKAKFDDEVVEYEQVMPSSFALYQQLLENK
jgi:hypothetical protein